MTEEERFEQNAIWAVCLGITFVLSVMIGLWLLAA
jgi:hypothetical protein